MPKRIYLDCCDNEQELTAVKKLRNKQEHTILGEISDVHEIRRFVIALDSAGVADPQSPPKTYYPDGASTTNPPKIFLVSVK